MILLGKSWKQMYFPLTSSVSLQICTLCYGIAQKQMSMCSSHANYLLSVQGWQPKRNSITAMLRWLLHIERVFMEYSTASALQWISFVLHKCRFIKISQHQEFFCVSMTLCFWPGQSKQYDAVSIIFAL